MSHGPETWRRILGMPLCGTIVIPPLARVDPSRFPEDEFPLQCPKCEYSLRGLREDVCPECGQRFDRGRLLVTQYAEQSSINTRFRRDYRTLAWLSVVGLVVLVLGYTWPWIPMLFVRMFGGSQPLMKSALTQIYVGNRVFYWLELALVVCVSVAVVRLMRKYHRDADRRRRVLAAIAAQQASPPPPVAH